jgi:hypothetical protein
MFPWESVKRLHDSYVALVGGAEEWSQKYVSVPSTGLEQGTSSGENSESTSPILVHNRFVYFLLPLK